MGKTKWNYAVVKSIFGDLWIGKTKLPVKRDKVFNDITEASHRAEMLFEDRHPDFDVDDEDSNDLELQDQYNALVNPEEDTLDTISKGVEKFIV